MNNLKELKRLAKDQQQCHIHDAAFLFSKGYSTIQNLDRYIEAYVQTRIMLALMYGETTI